MEMWRIKYSWQLAIPRHEPQQIIRCVFTLHPPSVSNFWGVKSSQGGYEVFMSNFSNIINSCRTTEYSIASGSNQVKKMIDIHLSNITAVTLMDEEVIPRFLEIWPGSPGWQQPWCSCSLVHDPRLMNSLRWLIVGFYWLTEVQGVLLLLEWRRLRLWCYGCSLQFLFLASSGHFLLSFNTYLFFELACPVMS